MKKKLVEWVSRNQRHLTAVVFLGSFVLDNLTLSRADVPWINMLFVAYLIIAAISILIIHFRVGKRSEGKKKSSRVPVDAIIMLIGQFFLGGLLSGCFIFYFRAADFWVSWPFVVLLGLIFIGSEFLHKYKEQLAFQCSLLFLTLYAYSIFALPIATGKMNGLVFLGSAAASLVLFAGFVVLLFVIDRVRLLESLRWLVMGIGSILVFVNVCYFTGILPPLPLALKDVGIYHSLTHASTGYTVETENRPFKLFGPQVVHHVAGDPLFAYSAVFAPIQLSTGIAHRWEYFDPQKRAWVTTALVEFPISGGRDNGYRGYSEAYAIVPGQWRISIETSSGQIIGRQRFDVVDVPVEPITNTETK
jgi:hypothetical protein